MKVHHILKLVLLTALINSCDKKDVPAEEWQPLFNNRDLTGWDIKIAGFPVNENYKNTFRVEDSMIRIVYDKYDKFDGHFGHLYYKTPLSYYKLRFQYRFTGVHLADAPAWGNRNSGVMVHSQAAQSLELNQDFPVSLEMQLLAATATDKKTTGNVCTPGTQLFFNNSLWKDHCLNSTSKSYPLDQWVSGIVEVYGDSLVRHIIEGDTVLTYTKPAIGGGFINENTTWAGFHIMDSASWIQKAGTPLQAGYIALQAESQPVDFRKIELLNLAGCTDPKAKNYKTYYIRSDNTKCTY